MVDKLDLRQLRACLIMRSSNDLQQLIDYRIAKLSHVEDVRLTIQIMEDYLRSKRVVIIAQSSMMHLGAVEEKTFEEHETVQEVGGDTTDVADSGQGFTTPITNSMLLDNFFNRPVKIFEANLALGADIDNVVRVWDLYTLNPSVRAKLRNYAHLRANLHLRVSISGTPFHYGRLLFSYQPYDRISSTLKHYRSSLVFTQALRQNSLNYLSQSKGAFTIDVKSNTPVDVVIPFISPKPWFRLYANSVNALSAASSYPDLVDAGGLYIYTLNQLNSVSDNDTNVGLQIYAWMEDVTVLSPSATQVAITTEARHGKLKDERIKGPVERYATSASTVADALLVIPEITPLAMASSMALKGLAQFASIFGWSRPTLAEPPREMKMVNNTPGCHGIGTDNAHRICLDPKNELSVDPRIVGVEVDEMSITALSSRESYLTTFSWTSSSTIMGSPIFHCAITPYLVTKAIYGTRTYVQPTALAFTAQPFQYWRGTIKFRFEIVCSSFHRGKLAFYYEPNLQQWAIIDAAISLNKQHVKIIDIQETQSIEFCVSFDSCRDWLLVNANSTDGLNAYATTLPSGLRDTYNGYIGVTAFNKLTAPENVPVSVNVYVSSDDIEYACPKAFNEYSERKIIAEGSHVTLDDVTCLDINEESSYSPDVAKLYFGERVVSFRTLMKRYCTDQTYAVVTQATPNTWVTVAKNNIPVNKLLYSTTPVAGTMTTLFDYLRYAYLGVKGSVRYRVTSYGSMLADRGQQLVVVNNAIQTNAPDVGSSLTTTTQTGNRGGIRFFPQNGEAVQYETPFFTNNLFVFSCSDSLDGTGIFEDDLMEDRWVRLHTVAYYTETISKTVNTRFDVASGEDFTFLRFIGAPYYSFVT